MQNTMYCIVLLNIKYMYIYTDQVEQKDTVAKQKNKYLASWNGVRAVILIISRI